MNLKHFASSLTIICILVVAAACGSDSISSSDDYPYEECAASLHEHFEYNYQTNQVAEVFSQHGQLEGITFQTADHPTRRARGYLYVAHVNGNQYYFKSNDEKTNLAFIIANERLINEVSSFVDLGRPPFRFYHAKNITEISLAPSASGISLSHGCNKTIGWLVHVWSAGGIPMWLSAGIEAVALSSMGEFEGSATPAIPLGFGDFLFSPSKWNTSVHVQAIDTAYHFVRHLIEIDDFDKIISLLMSRDMTDNKLLNTYFYEFSGGSLICDIQYTLLNRFGLYNVIASTEKATYFFIFTSFSRYIDANRMMNYIDFLDDGIRFVYNWHSRYFDFEFSRINRVDIVYNDRAWDNIGTGGMAFNENHMKLYYRTPEIDLSILVHKAVHVIDAQVFGAMPSFGPFAEGLADALNMLHSIADRDEFGIFYSWFMYTYASPESLLWFEGLLIDVLGSQNSACYFIYKFIHGFDPIGHTHFHAYCYLYHRETLFSHLGDLPREFFAPKLNPEVSLYIASYLTSSSFVQYLLETYGGEKYAQVHFNVNNFENVYGMTLHEMIDEWREFLRNFADDIRLAGDI